jgi:SAM-dependent methyltransferase
MAATKPPRSLDELSLKFVIASHKARRPLLDFGCGEGLATKAALMRGAHVCAVDPDEGAIGRLLAGIPSYQHPRLRTRVAELLDADFIDPGFDAIHLARVLEQFDGADVARILRNCFRWLYPNGKLFISVLTPAGPFWEAVGVELGRRKGAGERWPGYIEDTSLYFADDDLPGSIHLLEESTLHRELASVGFVVAESHCYQLPLHDAQVCCGMVAECGL